MLEKFLRNRNHLFASWRRLTMGLVILAASGTSISEVRADNGGSRIQFDVGNLISCRDITTLEFATANPGERILEARFQISVLSLTSPGNEIAELLLRIESPERTLQVADYFPKTTLTSEFVGPVKVERQSEQKKSLEFNINGTGGPATAHAAGSQQYQEKVTSQGQQLPPLELCAASGTILRGHGVYFKLCPTPRTSLEGAHDLVLLVRVPATWRADYLLVSCEAYGVSSNVLGTGGARVRRGAKSFIVATYLEGDVIAKSRAVGLVRAERDLRNAALTFQPQLKKNTTPDPFRELSSLIKGVDRRIPENWMEQVLFSSPAAQPFDDKLPTEVRVASLNYRNSKQQIQRLNSTSRIPTNGTVSNVGNVARNIQPANYSTTGPRMERLPPVEY